MTRYHTNKDGNTPFTAEEEAEADAADAAIAKKEADNAKEKYKTDRLRQYPPWWEQFYMMYHDKINGTTTWKDAIAKVKSDIPKP